MKRHAIRVLSISIALMAMLAGCGGQMNYAAAGLPKTSSVDNASSNTNNNRVITPTATPTPTPTPTPVLTGQLEVRDLAHDSKGLIFKNHILRGRVYNSSHQPLSGTLQVIFTKSGVIKDTQTKAISNLSPGTSMSFELTSTETTDNATAMIIGQR